MINYTNRDYPSIKQELINSIPKYTDKWTDFSDSDLGSIFIEFLAGTAAMLNYYIDKEVSECRIMQATESRNIFSNLELIGFKRPLRRCGVATGLLTAPANNYFDSRYNFPVVIPAFSIFNSSTEINTKTKFTNPKDIILPVGALSIPFKLVQGFNETKTFDFSKVQSYKLYLPAKDVSDEYFRLTVDDSEWELVDNAFLQTTGGMCYSIHRDAFDNYYVLFTYNYRDFMYYDSSITVEYVRTDGDVKVDVGVVNKPMFDVLSPSNVNIVGELEFKNTSSFTGGFVNEDLNLSKAKAISRVKTPKYLCTLEDYENAIFSYPGILDVRCVDLSNRQTSNIKPYELYAYILLDSNSTMSLEFKNDLKDFIYKKQDITRSVIIQDAIRKEIVFDIHFTVSNENINLIDLEHNIEALLEPYRNNISFGRVISRNHLITTILNNFPELTTLDIISPATDITPGLGEAIDIINIQARGDYYRQL